MFEINKNYKVEIEFIEGSPIYTIDNFYQDPDKVLELFLTVDPIIWKENQKPSFNQIFFDDRRHFFRSQQIIKVYKFLSKICKQSYSMEEDLILTNFTKFVKTEFNDYLSNYWWPHKDDGYNAILYLNKNDLSSGTNLYHHLNPNEDNIFIPEHYQPWKNKNNYQLIKSIKPKYNKMVLFDGLKFYHGMNICNEDYFGNNYRMNQVFFFKENNI